MSASCAQEHLFPRQTLCLVLLALEVPRGEPTAFSKHCSVIAGGGAGVVFAFKCFGWTWGSVEGRLSNARLGGDCQVGCITTTWVVC